MIYTDWMPSLKAAPFKKANTHARTDRTQLRFSREGAPPQVPRRMTVGSGTQVGKGQTKVKRAAGTRRGRKNRTLCSVPGPSPSPLPLEQTCSKSCPVPVVRMEAERPIGLVLPTRETQRKGVPSGNNTKDFWYYFGGFPPHMQHPSPPWVS